MATDVDEKKNINGDEWLKQINEQIKKAMEESITMVQADAMLNTPVKTGTLRRSITHEVTQTENKTIGVIGSNVEYAPFQEYKKHFLEDAIDKNIGAIDEKFKNLNGKA